MNFGKVSVDPEVITFNDVLSWKYPAPGSITLTEVNNPFSIIGVNTAPIPSPIILISGFEKYLLPEFKTITWTILPLLTIGWSWALLPESNVICGWWSKFITSDDPYPTPEFSRWIEVISPLTIGCKEASKVSDPIEDIPIFPIRSTEMSG